MDIRSLSKPQLALYCLWTGDSDFLRAYPPDGAGFGYLSVTNEIAWSRTVQGIVLSNSNAVQRLYDKGARTIVLQNLDDFSREPGGLMAFRGDTNGLQKLSEYIHRCNRSFADAMGLFAQARPDVRVVLVDVWSRLNEVLADPASIGATKTMVSALSDTLLLNKAFTGPGANYVFWDDGHLTSKLNEEVTQWTLNALTNAVLEELKVRGVDGLPTIQMNHLLIGRDYTLQRSSDLDAWEEVHSFTASAGTNQWTGTIDASTSAFFRLQWQP